MDIDKIKAEYIAGGISYRKLAEKYEISFSTLKRIAVKENWTSLREKAREKADTVLANSVGRSNGQKRIKIIDVADKLLEKMSKAIERADTIKPDALKQYTSALKDIKDIRGEKTGLDKKEQKARIAKLERDIEAASSKSITVTIVGDAEEFSN